MKLSKTIIIVLIIFLFNACSKFQKVTDLVTQPTARERYERGFKEVDSLWQNWTTDLTLAKQNKLKIPIPYTMSGSFQANHSKVLGYEIVLERGESLSVEILQTVDTSLVFIDLYRIRTDSLLVEKPVISNFWQKSMLKYEPKTSGRYKLIIQPEMNAATSYNLIIYTQPTFEFPVLGKENSNIQSFWGATRAGGSRSHEGIDIFASRGTPVVAITNGVVSSAGERGLGGKQVWLRSGVFGLSLYYAHLDSIAVMRGKRVKVGDTLGFVGNTGNAKTTSPHLHFGIYTSGGAINPLPFIKMNDIPTIASEKYETMGITKSSQSELRIGPNVSYEKLALMSKKDTVKILGKSLQWFHIKTKDSLEGFIHQSLLSAH